jgi:tetratricopeptide (TPR) repeat protein
MKIASYNLDQRAGTSYTADDVAAILEVPVERVCLWVSQGLLQPTQREPQAFDFRQLSIARTLRELVAAGVSLKKLRRNIEKLQRRLPQQQSAPILHEDGSVYARLDGGELAQADGQLCLEIAAPHTPQALPLQTPQTAEQLYELGTTREADGDLAGAITAYREALLLGGPSAQVSFALAHALAERGDQEQAAERYAQVIELEPRNSDAWNNMGVSLAHAAEYERARDAFRQAIEANPSNNRARYNLADVLDELDQKDEAIAHWREYLRGDSTSVWAAHARRRLAAI